MCGRGHLKYRCISVYFFGICLYLRSCRVYYILCFFFHFSISWLISFKRYFFIVLKNTSFLKGLHKFSSSRPEVFCNYQACNVIKKETVTQVISCEFYETFKNTYFYRTPGSTTSVRHLHINQEACLLLIVMVDSTLLMSKGFIYS